MSKRKELAETLQALRLKSGMTQKELALRSGFSSYQGYQRIEAGLVSVGFEKLCEIATL